MKIGRPCLFGVVLVLFSCAVVPQNRGAAEAVAPEYIDTDSLRAIYYYTEGVRLVGQSDDDSGASRMFERAIELDSLFAPALYGLANSTAATDRPKALEYSLRANSIEPDNLDYRSQLAYLRILNGNYREALELYNKLLVDDPRNPFNYKAVAILYNANEMPFTAIGILDSAEYKLGRIEDLADFKRELLVQVKLYDRAIKETEAAVVENPFDNGNYRILGELYDITGRDSLSLANFETAERLDSTDAATLFSLAGFYEKHRRENDYLNIMRRIFINAGVPFKTKQEIFERITSDIDFYRRNYFAVGALAAALIAYYPDDYSATSTYATHLLRGGETERALALFKDYATSHEQVEPYFAVLDIESYLERPDSVQYYADAAIERFPKNSDLFLRKGFALQNMNAPVGQSARAYRKAITFAADSVAKSSATGVLGDLYHTAGKHRQAFDTYRRALRLNPNNAVVLNNYAYYMSELGQQLDMALEMSTRACELSPSNSTYLDTKAWILYLMGRNDEAKKIMQQAISLDSSGNATLLAHYGDILAAMGENFMAKIYWERAQKAGYDSEAIEERIKTMEQQ